MSDSARAIWLEEIVKLRPPTGRARYLVGIAKERCPDCSRGMRTSTIWTTAWSHAEEVAWCNLCFNATCEAIQLGAEHRERFEAVRRAEAGGRAPLQWPAVRPALEDLERRGLI